MKRYSVVAAFAAVCMLPGIASSAPLYLNRFETDTTANWVVNKGPATTDEAHDFFFDYSTVGIPPAPNSGPQGTHGVKLQANQSSAVFGGMSVSPLGLDITAPDYKLAFDWWGNVNGPFPAGGSGSTQMSTFGVGTSGTVAQWPGGSQDSIWFGATGDGNSSSDWRAYSPTAPTRYADGNAVYAAPGGSTNASDPYYAGFGTVAAPAAQVLLYPQQTGLTLVGSAGMEWHEVVIEKLGANVTWKVDGTLIATVPVIDDTVIGGGNFFLGHSDTNGTSSTDPNDVNLLFTLIDNVRVVVPEPGSFSLLAIGLAGFILRRRR